MPTISLVLPCTSAAHLMSPSTLPSKCRSAVAARLPSMPMSAPNIVRLDFRFFENIVRYLQEGTGIRGLGERMDSCNLRTSPAPAIGFCKAPRVLANLDEPDLPKP